MARGVITLLLAVGLLAGVLFHPDAAVEGKEQVLARPEGLVPSNDVQCGPCEEEMWLHLTEARSPVNKVPTSEGITGVAENVCKHVTTDVLELIFQYEKGCCNLWKTIIESAWLEVMQYDNDIVAFIDEKKRSIQELKEFVCKERPRNAKGEDDDNASKWETKIKKMGSYVKNIKNNVRHNILQFFQTEKPTNRAKACKKLNASYV